MALEYLRPGDKIDIRLLQQIERSQMSGEEVLVFKSQIYEIEENNIVEISMPTQSGKVILFPVGAKLEAVFYSNSSLYRALVIVKERYKNGSLMVLKIEVLSKLVKYQRREFYRFDTVLDFRFYKIPEGVVKGLEDKDQYGKLKDYEPEEMFAATMVNISGGGAKIIAETSIKPKSRIMMEFYLVIGGEKVLFRLIGEIIEMFRIEGSQGKYTGRLKFIAIGKYNQERIIRYIFDEERRILKEKG